MPGPNAAISTYADVDGNPVPVSAANPMPSSATITAGDIQIGAVEIKNGTDDTRAAVGQGAAANGLRTADCTEDIARVGIITETAPASDTASSGLNGRLQRIAQRLTTLLPNLGAVASGTITQVNSAATSTTIAASNASRKGLILQNTDANDCYVKFGATAATTSFTVKILGNGGYWEMPLPIYTGVVDAIWAADGAGVMAVTEL